MAGHDLESDQSERGMPGMQQVLVKQLEEKSGFLPK